VRTRTLALVALVIIVLAGAGIATSVYVADDRAPPGPDDPTRVEPPEGLELPAARRVTPVLGSAFGPVVDTGAVRQRLAGLLADPDLGKHVGVAVRDLDRDRDVLAIGGGDTYTPASTLKLFTSAAALATLGADHRFETIVVLDRQGAGPPRAVLVGGGDPLLARTQQDRDSAYAPDVSTVASVDRLAATTARALRDAGVDRVRVGWDASLFSGPALALQWEPTYLPDEVVSPISALWVDEGRLGYGFSERSPDPAAAAAQELAEGLARQGLSVAGQPARATAGDAPVVASAQSAPLDEIVEHVLEVSDNEGAEVLLRHIGLATGRAGSFVGGTTGMRATLTGLGVPWRDVVTYDGSGLSRDNAVTLAAEMAVLSLGADPDHPELRTVVSGLPAARFNGSLAYRFIGTGTEAARGVVRAKTGTLTGVHGLTGSVVTRDGSLLGFALLTDKVRPIHTLDARAILDRLAAALAGCGCGR